MGTSRLMNSLLVKHGVKSTGRSLGFLLMAVILLFSGCATSTQDAQRQAEKETEIEAILTRATSVSEAQRCLRPSDFRNIRILDNQHIVFEGRGGRKWLNRLPMRCPGLHRNSVLSIERFSSMSSLCRLDTFAAHEWFEWPWYRRWPWYWAGGARCSLGEFHPVNEVQVEAVENAIRGERNR